LCQLYRPNKQRLPGVLALAIYSKKFGPIGLPQSSYSN
jgi:hypothetical protein